MNNPEQFGVKRERGERSPAPEDVKLASGDPLYYVFLTEADGAGIIKSADSQQAHNRLRELFVLDPESVLSCAGRSLEEAEAILSSIEMKKAA